MAMQAVTLTLKGKKGTKSEFKKLVDVGGKGVNGNTTKNEIMPALLAHWGISYTTFTLENFRYYLGGCIYQVTIQDGDTTRTGHLLLTKVMSSEPLSI